MKTDKVQDVFSLIQKLSPAQKEELDSRLKQLKQEEEMESILRNISQEVGDCIRTKEFRDMESFKITLESLETQVQNLKSYTY